MSFYSYQGKTATLTAAVRIVPESLLRMYAPAQTFNDAGQKSASGKSPFISSKPVSGQPPSAELDQGHDLWGMIRNSAAIKYKRAKSNARFGEDL
jgi:hypothetical protein